MKLIMARKWVARLMRVKWLPLMKKIASAFSPGLAKLGEVLVVSGAAALGLKGADGSVAFMAVDFSKIDTWWAMAAVVAGLIVWALATFFSEKKPCDKHDE
ncbi:hypothetical protein [Thiobacillus denitrificans]|uniref:hypothetical protein n=1 Tax=Thiobacillus denitrificans TaxID=36861 RepID=UPI00037830FF|nr:hypothetical protein [Thiobacillus denitrificans]